MRHSGWPQPWSFFAIMSLAAYGFPQWQRPANLARMAAPVRPVPPAFFAAVLVRRPSVAREGAGTGAAEPCEVRRRSG